MQAPRVQLAPVQQVLPAQAVPRVYKAQGAEQQGLPVPRAQQEARAQVEVPQGHPGHRAQMAQRVLPVQLVHRELQE